MANPEAYRKLQALNLDQLFCKTVRGLLTIVVFYLSTLGYSQTIQLVDNNTNNNTITTLHGYCTGPNFVYDVYWEDSSSPTTVEVVNAATNTVLATGSASPITDFTVPANVTHIRAGAIGGGGGGARRQGGGGTVGGGGGAAAQSVIQVQQSDVFTLSVAGTMSGAAGTSSAADSFIRNPSNTIVVRADGGRRQGQGQSNNPGTGGTVGNSVGQYRVAGQNGGTGNPGRGGNAADYIDGTGGGNGGSGNAAAGSAAGGGGAGRRSPSTGNGGTGARGGARIESYNTETSPPNVTVEQGNAQLDPTLPGNNDGTTFEITIAATTTGTVTVSLPAASVFDLAGNNNQASTSTDNLVTLINAPGGVPNNITLWLKANVGTNTTVNGNPISQWDDQSGASHNASQTNGTAQPSFNENSINFNPTIDFDNDISNGGVSRDYLDFASAAATAMNNTDNSFYIVSRYDNGAGFIGNGGRFLFHSSDGTGEEYDGNGGNPSLYEENIGLRFSSPSTSNAVGYYYQNDIDTNPYRIRGSEEITLDTPFMYSIFRDPASAQVYVDSELKGNDNSYSGTPIPPTFARIGGHQDTDAFDRFFDGSIAEMVIYR